MRSSLHITCLVVAVLLGGCKGRPAAGPASPMVAEPAVGARESAPATPGAPPTPGASAGPSTGAPTVPPAPAAVPVQRDPSLLWENDLSVLGNDYECALKEVVSSPQGQDPRAVIWRAYDAARKAVVEGADGPHADEFVDQFSHLQKRDWILEQYWPRIKTHISKYTSSSKDTTFVLCRIYERDGRWKGFVKSFSRDKSNPPITVEIEDGVPRISFFTY